MEEDLTRCKFETVAEFESFIDSLLQAINSSNARLLKVFNEEMSLAKEELLIFCTHMIYKCFRKFSREEKIEFVKKNEFKHYGDSLIEFDVSSKSLEC